MKNSQALITAGLTIRMRLAVNAILTVITILFVVVIHTPCQNPVLQRDVLTASQEKFFVADGLITVSAPRGKSVYIDTIRPYNADGSLWYEFSLDSNNPLYFGLHPKSDFKPFSPLDYFWIALRLKAISRNWYEVLIDDKSQDTRFMKAGDILLRRETFERYVLMSSFIKFNQESNPLRESPAGQIWSERILAKELFGPVRIDGEWLLVELLSGSRNVPRSFGWIRWKEDREILIQFMLNCKTCL